MSLGNGLMNMVGLGLGGASTAWDSYYAYQEAKAQEAQARWEAARLEDNAALQQVMAQQALQKGEHDVAIAKREGTLLIEKQRVGYAASGVKVDEGSALDVVAEQAGRNQYDQDMLKYNSELEAWGHNVEAANLRQQAQITRATKRSASAVATGSLLSGSTSLFNQYRRYQVD